MTRPKTTCFPSRKSHFAVVMKNWHPFVFGPEFACGCGGCGGCVREDRYVISVCDFKSDARHVPYHGQQTGSGVLLFEVLILRGIRKTTPFRSRGYKLTGNLSPYIEKEPVPSPLRKSPPNQPRALSVLGPLQTKEDGSRSTLAHEIWYPAFMVSCEDDKRDRFRVLTLYEMTALYQQAWAKETIGNSVTDSPVESCALVSLWPGVQSVLSRAELPEVLGGP